MGGVHMFRKWKKSWRRLHPFVRDVIKGAYQWTFVMYAFSAQCYGIAPYTPDYFRTLEYGDASISVAPVLLAAGIVAAVIAHAVLGTVEEEPSHSSKDRPPRS